MDGSLDNPAELQTTVRRFAVLRHVTPATDARPSHFDLLIENGDTLATWALSQPLSEAGRQTACQLPAHRLLYLDYEGPISNNRGEVRRVAGGKCSLLEQSEHRWRIRFDDESLEGELTLERQSADSWSACFVGSNSDGGK